MTDFDLSALKALFAKTTQGEWSTTRKDDWSSKTVIETKDDCIADCDVSDRPAEDAAWISAIHNAFPALVSAIEGMEAEVASLKKDGAAAVEVIEDFESGLYSIANGKGTKAMLKSRARKALNGRTPVLIAVLKYKLGAAEARIAELEAEKMELRAKAKAEEAAAWEAELKPFLNFGLFEMEDIAICESCHAPLLPGERCTASDVTGCWRYATGRAIDECAGDARKRIGALLFDAENERRAAIRSKITPPANGDAG